jgi:hypothetical protein
MNETCCDAWSADAHNITMLVALCCLPQTAEKGGTYCTIFVPLSAKLPVLACKTGNHFTPFFQRICATGKLLLFIACVTIFNF